MVDMVGGPDNVAGLFNFSNYNLTAWMTDYLDEAMGNYYTCLLYTSGIVLILLKQRKGLHSKKVVPGVYVYAHSRKI